MNESKNVGECVNVFIPPDKAKEFWEIITSEGYEPNGKGIFNFVIESFLDEDEEENEPLNIGSSAFKKWASENPDEWKRIKEKGTNAISALLGKISKKF